MIYSNAFFHTEKGILLYLGDKKSIIVDREGRASSNRHPLKRLIKKGLVKKTRRVYRVSSTLRLSEISLTKKSKERLKRIK